MAEGLKWFLILVIPAVVVIYGLVCLLNYKKNFLWWNRQLKLLEVGEYRWHQGSPKWGVGHRVVVVKSIDKKKRKIVYDEWGRTEEGWKQLQEGVEISVSAFFDFTHGEPCYWVGCSEDLSKE